MLQLALAAVAAATWTTSAPVVERAPRPTDLLAYPHDGQTAGVNPPGFCWTPSEAARGYRLEVRKSDESSRTVISTAALTSTVYPPVQKLDPGEYLWQVIYLDAGGKAVGASRTRRFRLPAGAPVLLMPDAGALKARLAKVRPRLFLAGGRLEQLRSRVRQGAAPSWERMRKAASAALDEKPYAEPEPYRPGVPSDQEWRRTYTPGKVGSAHVARTALAYIITGELKYLEGARRWMMTLAGWDPKGITSHGLKMPNSQIGNDEASMPMLDRMSLAWDWIGDKLTATERAAVLASMTERGNQVLRVLERQDFLSHPFNNHSGRAIAFLGNAGLAFLGDIPDAEKWLDYVLRSYLTSYPGWGGDEGGWSQGLSYWGFYVFGHANFIEALRQVTGTDIFRRPFYRHTGYLPVYFHPPYAPRGAFGDGGYHRPSEVEAILTDRLAGVFRDPVLKWQALGMLDWLDWLVLVALAVFARFYVREAQRRRSR